MTSRRQPVNIYYHYLENPKADGMQILAHIPEDLGNRFKAAIPARKRSAFIADLLRKALPAEDEALYQLALAVEQDQGLADGLEGWDATVADGLEEGR